MSKYLELKNNFLDLNQYIKAVLQKPYVAYSINEEKIIYSGIIYQRIVDKDITNITYEPVDLGLPSGKKWADKNIGASNPDEIGSYFQWGDTKGYTSSGFGNITSKDFYYISAELLFCADILRLLPDGLTYYDAINTISEDNAADFYYHIVQKAIEKNKINKLLMFLNRSAISVDKKFNWSNYFDTTDEGNTFTKYKNDDLTSLAPENDAATVNMGAGWKTPTVEDFEELISNTTRTYIDYNGNEYTAEQVEVREQDSVDLRGGVKCVKLTGKNNNYILIPFYNRCVDISLAEGIPLSDSEVLLQTSDLSKDNDTTCVDFQLGYSYDFNFIDFDNKFLNADRCIGAAIRGVCE